MQDSPIAWSSKWIASLRMPWANLIASNCLEFNLAIWGHPSLVGTCWTQQNLTKNDKNTCMYIRCTNVHYPKVTQEEPANCTNTSYHMFEDCSRISSLLLLVCLQYQSPLNVCYETQAELELILARFTIR